MGTKCTNLILFFMAHREEIRFEEYISRRNSESRHQANKKHPRIVSELISKLYEVSDEDLIRIISRLDNTHSVEELSQDIDDFDFKSMVEGEREMKRDFFKALIQRIERCFIIIRDKGINLNSPQEKKFYTAIKLLFSEYTELETTSSLIECIWKIIEETTNFSVLIEYLTILFSLSKRISGRNSFKELRNSIEEEMKKILDWKGEGNENLNSKLEIIENEVLLSENERIVLKMEVIRYLNKIKEEPLIDEQEAIENQIFTQMKKGSCQQLLQNLGRFYKTFEFIEKVFDEFLECKMDTDKLCYVSKNNKIHRNMLSLENLLFCLKEKKSNSVEHLKMDSILIQNDKIYCKFNLGMLEAMEQQIVNRSARASGRILFNLHALIATLLENKGLSLSFMEKYSNRQIPCEEYLCKIFQLMTKYIFMFFGGRECEEIQLCFEEQFLTKLLDNFRLWSLDPLFRHKKFLVQALGDLYSFSSYYLTYFSSSTDILELNLKKKLIDASVELILNSKYINEEWRILKHVRLLIQNWAISTEIPGEKIKQMLQIFWSAFLSPKFSFTRDSYYNFIEQNEAPSLAYQEEFSKILLEKIEQFATKIILDHDLETNLEKRNEKDVFIFKIHLILLGNFKLTTADEIAKILYVIYEKYSPLVPSIYRLRTWITYHYKPVQYTNVQELSEKIAHDLSCMPFILENQLTAKQCLEFELPSTIENHLDVQVKFRNFLKSMQGLLNILDLKNQCQNFSAQVYQTLICKILNPLSDCLGQIYHKILQQISESKDNQQYFQKVLIRNFFSDKKSIYRNINEVMFQLKNLIRLYLCNVTFLINFEEAKHISEEIGKLFHDLPNLNENQQRIRIQLINEVLATRRFKRKSHLIESQTIRMSNAYQISYKFSQSLGRGDFQFLSILIPLFNKMRPKFPEFISILSSFEQKYPETQEMPIYNHQIAFESDLRKLIPEVKKFQTARKNTIVLYSKLLLENIFLPKINNKNEHLEKAGLRFYWQQFKAIYDEEKCTKCIQDNLAIFLRIYKFKNRGEGRHLREETRTQGEESPDFSQYGVEPLEYDDFKAHAKTVLNQILEKVPQRIFGSYGENLNFKAILNLVKELSEVNNESGKQNADSSIADFLTKILTKSKDKLESEIKKIVEEKEKKNPQQIKEGQGNTEQRQNDSIAEQRVEEKKKQKKEKKDKKEKAQRIMTRPKTNLTTVFKILAHINRDHVKAVAICFSLGIQQLLLQFMEKSKNRTEINEAVSFINETMPTVHKDLSEEAVNQIAKYYSTILQTFSKVNKKKILEEPQILRKIAHLSQNFKEVKRPELANYFTEQVFARLKVNIEDEDLFQKTQIVNILNRLLESKEVMTERIMEFKIKSYLLNHYYQNIKRNKKAVKSETNLEQKFEIEIEADKYLKNLSPLIQKDKEKFQNISKRLFLRNQNGQNLVLIKRINQLIEPIDSQSENFVSFTVPTIHEKIFTFLLDTLTQVNCECEEYLRSQGQENKKNEEKKKKLSFKQKKIKNKEVLRKLNKIQKRDKIVRIVCEILEENPLFIPYVLNRKVLNSNDDFLEWVIKATLFSFEKIYLGLLTKLMCKNGLIFDIENNISFSDYVCARVIKFCLINFEKNDIPVKKLIYLILVCLCHKNFNNFSHTPINEEEKIETLMKYIEKGLEKESSEFLKQIKGNIENIHEGPISILYEECFYLIHKFRNVEKLKEKNKMYENFRKQDEYLSANIFLEKKEKVIRVRGEDVPRFLRKRELDAQNPNLFEKFNNPQDYELLPKYFHWDSLDQVIEKIEHIVSSTKPSDQQNSQSCIQFHAEGSLKGEVINENYKHYDKKLEKRRRKFYQSDDEDNRNNEVTAESEIFPYLLRFKDIAIQKSNNLQHDLRIERRGRPISSSEWEESERSQSESQDDNDDDSDSDDDRGFEPFRRRLDDNQNEFGRRIYGREKEGPLISPAQFVKLFEKLDKTISSPRKISSPQKTQMKIKDTSEGKQCETQVQEMPDVSRLRLTKSKSKNEEISEGVAAKKENYKAKEMEKTELDIIEEENETPSMRAARILSEFGLNEAYLQEKGIERGQFEKMTKQEQVNLLSLETTLEEQKEKEQKIDPELLKNENFKKLHDLNFYERSDFLIDAPEDFFDGLPIEVMQQVMRERDILQRQNNRSLMVKGGNDREDEDFFAHERRRRRRKIAIRKGAEKKRAQYDQIDEEEQISEKMAIAIIRTMLIQPEEDSEKNPGYGISLLLENSRNKIKQKTLTTLLLIMKNIDKLNLLAAKKVKNESNWSYKHRKDQRGLKDSQRNLRDKILIAIQCSIEKSLCPNEDLVTKRVPFSEYYEEVFDFKLDEMELFSEQLGRDKETYMPLNELIDLCLESSPKFLSTLITKTKSLPNVLINKIFNAMAEEKVDKNFYKNLENFSENQVLIELFKEKYSLAKPPSYELLGRIMKYKFGKLDFVRKLHLKALTCYMPSYNEYLKEILGFYSLEEIKEKKADLITFKQIHYKLIESTLEEEGTLDNSPLKILVHVPDLLEFKTKMMIFENHPKFEFSDSYYTIHIAGDSLLRSSYNQIMALTPIECRKRITPKYIKQDIIGPGALRSWLHHVSQELLNPQYLLFVPVEYQNMFQPNPYSFYNPEYLHYFKFIGRLIGISIIQKEVFPLSFPLIFHQMLKNIKPHWKDLKENHKSDYERIQGFLKMRDDGSIHDIKGVLMEDVYFVYKGKDMQGQTIQKELIADGSSLTLNNDNLDLYIELTTTAVMTDFCTLQYEQIKEGLYEIIHPDSLSIFSTGDLDLLISGVPDIDVEKMEKTTKYSGFSKEDPTIKWFWEILHESTKEEVANIMQYITASSKLYQGGFSNSDNFIKIYLDPSEKKKLPWSNTCSRKVNIQEYSCKESLKKDLALAISLAEKGQGLGIL